MKRLKVLFIAIMMIFAVQMNAKADETMVEAYAHPSNTLFISFNLSLFPVANIIFMFLLTVCPH